MNQQIEPLLRELTPSWESDEYTIAAVQKSGGVQYGHVPVSFAGGKAIATLGYRRYIDCDQKDAPGQDYAVIRGDRQHLIGVIADGVGQSFYGNLAAEKVGTWLLEYLWKERTNLPDSDALELELKEAERAFSSEIANVSLAHLPAWHQTALERTRQAGSQSVLAAFVWRMALQRARVYVVGDINVLALRQGRAEKIQADPKGRWSSAGKSNLHLLTTDLDCVSAILLKTDGADPEWGLDIALETADADEFARMASARANNDDVSFVAASMADIAESEPAGAPRRSDIQPLSEENSRRSVSTFPDSSPPAAPALNAFSPSEPYGLTSRQRRSDQSRIATRVRVRVTGLATIVIVACAMVAGIAHFASLWQLRQSGRQAGSGVKVITDVKVTPELKFTPVHTVPPFAAKILHDKPDGVVFQISSKLYLGFSLEGSDRAVTSSLAAFADQDTLYALLPAARTSHPQVKIRLFRDGAKQSATGSFRITDPAVLCYEISAEAH